MPDPKETPKTSPLITAGIVGVVSVMGFVLLFFLIQVIREGDGTPHGSPSERVYHVQDSKRGWQIAFVSEDACYEANAAAMHSDKAAFDKVIKNKGIRISTGTPVQKMEQLQGDVIDLKVLSGAHKGETVYMHARDIY